ncbi:unnamed protein product [Pleuronectes platessa]|uniref:Uncharacterized protein n=1 Tax=Pleuronectes platessa TaxID=8262 RepID=A0A9N7V8R3_PLEPL|nr:unnamed protein product [Pleuronectes platessa]
MMMMTTEHKAASSSHHHHHHHSRDEVSPLPNDPRRGGHRFMSVLRSEGTSARDAHRYLFLLLDRFRRRVAFLRRGHDSLRLGEKLLLPRREEEEEEEEEENRCANAGGCTGAAAAAEEEERRWRRRKRHGAAAKVRNNKNLSGSERGGDS